MNVDSITHARILHSKSSPNSPFSPNNNAFLHIWQKFSDSKRNISVSFGL